MEKLSQSVSNKIANMGIVCALLVVGIHCGGDFVHGSSAWWLHEIVGGSLGKIAVPYFFCVAGFLLGGTVGVKGWWKQAIVKRSRSLLVPFFFWNVCMLAVALAMTLAANIIGGHDILRNISVPYILAELGFRLDRQPIDAPLWFVRTLFLLVLLSPLIRYFAKSRILFGILVGGFLLTTIGCNVQRGPDVLLGSKAFGLHYDDFKAIVYFAIGMQLRILGGAFPVFAKKFVITLFILTWGGTVVCDSFQTPRAFQLSQLFIPFGILTLWVFIPATKWPAKFTNLSFPIYCIHFPIMRYYSLIPRISYLQAHRGDSAALLSLYFVFVCVVSVGAVLLMKRFGTLSMLAFGGRAERK